MLRGNRSSGGWIIAAALVMTVVAAAAQRSSVEKPNAAVPVPNFARDIAPILIRNCVSCHRPGESGPFSLLSYADAKKHAEEIATATGTRVMPPWLPAAGYGDFADEHRLTADEIASITNWVKGGAPEGPASETPPVPHFAEGWQLGPPDMIVEATRAFTFLRTVRTFSIILFFRRDHHQKYFARSKFVPEITHGVHHANVIVDRSRSARRQEIGARRRLSRNGCENSSQCFRFR